LYSLLARAAEFIVKKRNAIPSESLRPWSRQAGAISGSTGVSTPRSPLDSELKPEVEHGKLFVEDLGGKSTRSAADLFSAFAAAEKAVNNFSLYHFKSAITKSLLFPKPLFESVPVINQSSPFHPEVTLKIRTQLRQAQKYREILDYVAQARSRKGRLFVIAWWLKEEGVCEPEDILDHEWFHRFVKKWCGRISDADFRHADQVRTWVPYFERLLQDRREQGSAKLVELGYPSDAVRSCLSRRSAVEAACDWLASRPGCEGIDAPSFRNAYSRIYGPKRRRSRATGSPARKASFKKKESGKCDDC
jgi:hypothetical protein